MVISRLRPLDIEVSVPDRDFRLGDTINIDVELEANRDCEVREGRVDLMLEERWIEQYSTTVEKPIFARVQSGTWGTGYSKQTGSVTETKAGTDHHESIIVHSSATFLKDATLKSGRPGRYTVGLTIKPDMPANAGTATLKWWLQTAIDVAGARDVGERTEVRVVV